MGYCPQFDALLDRLTGYETLALFARLRGIPEKDVGRVTNSVIDAVGIEKYAQRLTKTYRFKILKFSMRPTVHPFQ